MLTACLVLLVFLLLEDQNASPVSELSSNYIQTSNGKSCLSIGLLPFVAAVFSRAIVSHRKCNGMLQMVFVFSYSQLLYFPCVINQVIIVQHYTL